MKNTILYRAIFALGVIALWVYSMFPIKDQNFFDVLETQSAKIIASNKKDDKTIAKLNDEISSLEQKINITDVKIAEREAYKDEEANTQHEFTIKELREANSFYHRQLSQKQRERDQVLSEQEIKGFKEVVATAKKIAKENTSMTEGQALIEACKKNEKVELFKFYPVGYPAQNQTVAREIAKDSSGKVKGGIDLVGGVQFTVTFDPEDKGLIDAKTKTKKDLVEVRNTIMEVLENRINSSGLADVTIQKVTDTSFNITIPKLNKLQVEQTKNLLSKPAKLTFHSVNSSNQNLAGYETIPMHNSSRTINIKIQPAMTGNNIIDAYVQQNEKGQYVVHKKFNSKGAEEFAKVTNEHLKQPLAIVLDGICYSAPTIQDILSSQATITGDFKKDEAEELALVLKSGALPVDIKLAGELEISSELGKDSINKGVYSALAGFVLVLVFILFYYRLKSGAVAISCLLLNVLLVFGTMTILGASFTLPGIAGIVLTIGMAIDANILIFERIREEMQTGKVYANAVREGFQKAFITIFDANITTLFTAGVLYKFLTGSIQGFAVTLAIGIASSMFTSLFIGKIFFDYYVSKNPHGTFTSRSFLISPSIDFWSKRKITFAISIIICVLSIITIASKQEKALAIDFTGGVNLLYSTTDNKPINLEEAQKLFPKNYKIRTTTVNEKQGLQISLQENATTSNIANEILAKLNSKNQKFAFEKQAKVGSVVADKFQSDALKSVIWSLIIIFIYISFRFEPIFALGAITALAHDTLICLGIFFMSGYQLSLSAVAALLTVIGYSLNDTIVVFDRIRENTTLDKKSTASELINKSINNTLSRTILTSITTLLVIIIIFFFGSDGLKDFSFLLLIGILVGTYSSAFIAAPIVGGRNREDSKMMKQLEKINEEKQRRLLAKENDQTVIR